MRRPWRGRVRDRVWKAFTALAGETVPTGELVRRCWPRKSRFDFGLLPQAAGQIDGSRASVLGLSPRPDFGSIVVVLCVYSASYATSLTATCRRAQSGASARNDKAARGSRMGLGPTILSLYHQLKQLGTFDGSTASSNWVPRGSGARIGDC
jgi:hypothetical protein